MQRQGSCLLKRGITLRIYNKRDFPFPCQYKNTHKKTKLYSLWTYDGKVMAKHLTIKGGHNTIQ